MQLLNHPGRIAASNCAFCRASSESGRRRGATLVEFAMVMPVLLLLTLAMIQFGILINVRLSLSNSMRQIARYGAVNASKPGADDSIKAYAIQTAKGYGLTLKNENITVGPPLENTTDNSKNRERYVTQLPIQLDYDLSPHFFLPAAFPDMTFLFQKRAHYEVQVMVE